MAVDFSRNALLSVSKEASYNTYIATGHEGIRILPGMRMTLNRDIREAASARGQAAESPFDMAAGLRNWSLEFTCNLPKEALAHLLRGMFGAVVTTAIGTYKKHVFFINDPALGTDATPPSLSVRILDDNREWNLSGGVVTRLTVTMALANFWQVGISMVGGSFVDAAIGAAPTYTPALAGRYYLLSDDFDFKLNTGGAANWSPTDFEVTFERSYADGPTESYQAGSAERIRLVSAGTPAIKVTGTTRRLYDGITQFDLFDAYTQFRIEALNKVVAGENLVAVNSDGYALTMVFEKCYLVDWQKEDAGGITMQRLSWRATYSGTGSDILTTTQDTLTTPVTEGTP